jgi:hypothetical protein
VSIGVPLCSILAEWCPFVSHFVSHRSRWCPILCPIWTKWCPIHDRMVSHLPSLRVPTSPSDCGTVLCLLLCWHPHAWGKIISVSHVGTMASHPGKMASHLVSLRVPTCPGAATLDMCSKQFGLAPERCITHILRRRRCSISLLGDRRPGQPCCRQGCS